MPRISVVIPTYKHRDYVLATLESVYRQTGDDYEIIVVNDGSPDETAAVLKPLVRAGRITYVEQPNAGQAAARNRGLQEARGEYIAYLDDDDSWPPGKLAWQTEFLDQHPDVGIVGGAVERFADAGQSLGVVANTGDISFESLFSRNPMISPGQCLIRASLLRELGGYDPRVWGADDWDLWFRAVQKMKLVMDARPSLNYRVHATNASRDLARMLKNSLLVVNRHLGALPPGLRPAARRSAHRLLFEYLGSAVARGIVPALWRGQLRRAAVSLSLTSRFILPALKDPKLLMIGGRDLVPTGLRRFALRLKRGSKPQVSSPGK